MASFNKNTPIPREDFHVFRQLSVNKNQPPSSNDNSIVIQELFDKIKFLSQDLISLSQKVNELSKQNTSTNTNQTTSSIQKFEELLEQEKYKNDIQENRLLTLEMEVMRLKDKR